MCIFPGLLCQWELTSHVSLISHSKVCWCDKPPLHVRCLFVWSPPSLSVPIKQNTRGKTQNINNFDKHVAWLSSNIQCGNRIVCIYEDACARNALFLSLRARVGVCTRFHRPVYGVSLSAVCVCVLATVTWGLSVNHRVDMEDFSHRSFSTVGFCSTTAHIHNHTHKNAAVYTQCLGSIFSCEF